jgi:hypothetical protein
MLVFRWIELDLSPWGEQTRSHNLMSMWPCIVDLVKVKNLLDAPKYVVIASKCFGHQYDHRQEYNLGIFSAFTWPNLEIRLGLLPQANETTSSNLVYQHYFRFSWHPVNNSIHIWKDSWGSYPHVSHNITTAAKLSLASFLQISILHSSIQHQRNAKHGYDE